MHECANAIKSKSRVLGIYIPGLPEKSSIKLLTKTEICKDIKMQIRCLEVHSRKPRTFLSWWFILIYIPFTCQQCNVVVEAMWKTIKHKKNQSQQKSGYSEGNCDGPRGFNALRLPPSVSSIRIPLKDLKTSFSKSRKQSENYYI